MTTIDLETYHALGFSTFRDPPTLARSLIVCHRSTVSSTDHTDGITLDEHSGDWLVASIAQLFIYGVFNTHQEALSALTALEMIRNG